MSEATRMVIACLSPVLMIALFHVPRLRAWAQRHKAEGFTIIFAPSMIAFGKWDSAFEVVRTVLWVGVIYMVGGWTAAGASRQTPEPPAVCPTCGRSADAPKTPASG